MKLSEVEVQDIELTKLTGGIDEEVLRDMLQTSARLTIKGYVVSKGGLISPSNTGKTINLFMKNHAPKSMSNLEYPERDWKTSTIEFKLFFYSIKHKMIFARIEATDGRSMDQHDFDIAYIELTGDWNILSKAVRGGEEIHPSSYLDKHEDDVDFFKLFPQAKKVWATP